MSQYKILVNILDKIRSEAHESLVSYNPPIENVEKINLARSWAYIHLYLKACLGLIDFNERESYLTDGVNDGGIDAFYIDYETKSIYFIQSKFRTNENNFHNKDILLEEILKMDISRIIEGEVTHENGVPYNSKILAMQKKIQEIKDIARYRYEVIILANLTKVGDSKIKILTGGFPGTVYDFSKTFSDLVFPIISGTYYNYSDLAININLSNKSYNANINYSVDVELGTADITVLFVPLYEIGKLMYKYKNSILKYNPRSFLALKEGSINDEIRQTILDKNTNEFALFNNGITILSDETSYNQHIGKKNTGQIILKNPQIINGGQTAFTLSLIYENSLSEIDLKDKLDSKEVLVKVITFSLNNETTVSKKLQLIEDISEATNKQNEVNSADRNSNNPLLLDSQKLLFSDFGLLLERKRGEFFDGLRYEYVDKSNIVDRQIFMKIGYACLGYPVVPKKEKQLFTEGKIEFLLSDKSKFKKYYFGYLVHLAFVDVAKKKRIAQAIPEAQFAIISLCVQKYFDDAKKKIELESIAKEAVNLITLEWGAFEDFFMTQIHNNVFFEYNYNFANNSFKLKSNFIAYFKSASVQMDMNNYFYNGEFKFVEANGMRKQKKSIENLLSIRNLTFKQVLEIRTRVNPAFWFDDDLNKLISKEMDIDIRTVRYAIKLFTAKDTGYYFSNYLIKE